uniref:Ig-like domain-containing protein n=1 Tax=Pelusios castaneus TaxID=367368 RepID=A0A8C8RST6_9SAUR
MYLHYIFCQLIHARFLCCTISLSIQTSPSIGFFLHLCFSLLYFWHLVFLSLLLMCLYHLSDSQYISGGGVGNEGASIRLSCKGSGFSFSNYDMFWYRQSPRKGPEFVSYISYDGTRQSYADSVKGRVTISRDNSRSELYLQMSSLRLEDTARYYCATDTVRGSQSGLRHKPLPTPPKCQAQARFSPSVSIMKSENESIAACLVNDFYPKELKIVMNPDSQTIYEATDPILTSNGKYSAVKVVKLSSDGTVSCSIQHNSKLIKKTLIVEKPSGILSGVKADCIIPLR